MRVNQDAYIVQGLMSQADVLNGDLDTLPNAQATQDAESGQVRRRLSFDEDAAAAAAAVGAITREVTSGSRSQSCIPFGKRLGAGMVDTGSVAGGSSRSLNLGASLQNGRASPNFLTNSGKKQQRQTNVDSNLENGESSFIANIKTSRDLATSTPRRSDLHHRPTGSAPSATRNQNGGSLGRKTVGSDSDSDSLSTDALPERLRLLATSSSLRQKRPASVGAIPVRPGRGLDRWAAGASRWPSQQSMEGVLSG